MISNLLVIFFKTPICSSRSCKRITSTKTRSENFNNDSSTVHSIFSTNSYILTLHSSSSLIYGTNIITWVSIVSHFIKSTKCKWTHVENFLYVTTIICNALLRKILTHTTTQLYVLQHYKSFLIHLLEIFGLDTFFGVSFGEESINWERWSILSMRCGWCWGLINSASFWCHGFATNKAQQHKIMQENWEEFE